MDGFLIAGIVLFTITVLASIIFYSLTLPQKIRAYKFARRQNATIYVARKFAKENYMGF